MTIIRNKYNCSKKAENQDDSANPMIQAMELDAVHHEHHQQGRSKGRSRRSSRLINTKYYTKDPFDETCIFFCL
jgi:hypothetical protein